MTPSILSLVPARAGSKGVLNKNTRLLSACPLIAYSIILSRACNLRTIVTTDSQDIAEIAKRYGAEVPFLRPVELAQDNSPDIEFMRHAIDWLQQNEGQVPEYIVHLRPTTPLRDPEVIQEAIELFIDSDSTALKSVHEEIQESPYKCFNIKDGYLKGIFEETGIVNTQKYPEYYNLPRQLFPKAYKSNGYIDIVKSEVILEGSMYGKKLMPYITDYTVEIDSIEELDYLQYILNEKGHLLANYMKGSI